MIASTGFATKNEGGSGRQVRCIRRGDLWSPGAPQRRKERKLPSLANHIVILCDITVAQQDASTCQRGETPYYTIIYGSPLGWL